jgi:hypothetical protein
MQGLRIRNAFEGLVERNMEPALAQRHKDATCDAMKRDTIRILPCEFL